MGEMSSILFPYYPYIGGLYICFLLYFLEISSESMATKEATEIKEEAVTPKAGRRARAVVPSRADGADEVGAGGARVSAGDFFGPLCRP